MKRPLPSRTEVLAALEREEHPVHYEELGRKLDVAPASAQGLLRLLDDLVFDGVLVASGENFVLADKARASVRPQALAAKPAPAGHGRATSSSSATGAKSSSNVRSREAGRRERTSEPPRKVVVETPAFSGKRGDKADKRDKADKQGKSKHWGAEQAPAPIGWTEEDASSNESSGGSDDATGSSRDRSDRSDRSDRNKKALPSSFATPQTRGGPPSRTSRGRELDREAREEWRSRHGGRGGERREGTLTVNPRGFGFVASPTATGDDVFIGEGSLGGAMHGDTVIVEITGRGSRGAEGQIVEITKRGKVRASGILRRRGKSAWIEPDDPRIRGPIVLTREIDLAGPEGNSGADGQVVVVEITRFPEEPGENPEGRLIGVLGSPGDLGVEVRKILMLEQIEEVHSSEAIAEAEAYGVEVPREMLEGREDLTHIPLPTIDPEDARDHDDAVWVERSPRGGYEVWVAIADVSSYVRPGTKIDEEAMARGCSIYLPDRAIPMLPRALSSNLCSLLPDVTRLCLCVYAELDAKGEVKKTRLIRGFMKSQAKLTYGGVARALGFTANPPRDPKAEAMVDGLRVAHECARLLRSRRMKRGSLDFDLPEPVVKLDAEGKPTSVTKRSNDPGVKKAYQLIEDLMIFANEVVARWLVANDLPGVYRVHLPPDPQKLTRLATLCDLLGIELDIEDTQTPKGLSEVLKSFADHPNANVLNNLLLRSLKQATYDIANLGHFGLASDAYLHFTSPIRRYPDLVVHRIVHAALSDERNRKKAVARVADKEELTASALQSSQAERRAMEVERSILDIYRCFYMLDRIGETFEGGISAFVGSGAFVTLDEPFVDVLVKLEDLGGDFQIEDDGLMASSGRSGEAVRLGDRIMVQISDVAILRRTIYARRMRGDGEAIWNEGNVRGNDGRGARMAKGKGKAGRFEGRDASRGGSDAPRRTFGSDRRDGGTGKKGDAGRDAGGPPRKGKLKGKTVKGGKPAKLGKKGKGGKKR